MHVRVPQHPETGQVDGAPHVRLAHQAFIAMGIPQPQVTHGAALTTLIERLRVRAVGWDGGYTITIPDHEMQALVGQAPPVLSPSRDISDAPVVPRPTASSSKPSPRTSSSSLPGAQPLATPMRELLVALDLGDIATEDGLARALVNKPRFFLERLREQLVTSEFQGKFPTTDLQALYDAITRQITLLYQASLQHAMRQRLEKRKQRFVLSLGVRLTEIADMLLSGTHDEAMLEAFQSLRKDFADLHESYAEYKDKRLYAMTSAPDRRGEILDKAVGRSVKAVQASGLDSEQLDAEASGKITRTIGKQLRPSNQRGNPRYLALTHGGSYMRSLDIQIYDYFSWMSAMTNLTVFRREMQGDDMAKFMHRRTGDTYHAFTQLMLGANHLPSGVWIHNTKTTSGEGATRVISFVDDDGNIVSPDVYDEATDLSRLNIVDISYEELSAMLDEIRDRHLGGEDHKLAEMLCNVMGFRDSGHRLKIRTYETRLAYQPKIKNLLTGKLVKLRKTHVPLGVVCITFLSILFLTEPRHALPMWVTNMDALECVAAGQITLDHLLGAAMICSVLPVRKHATLRLVFHEPEADLTSIGFLLASGNTAGTTLSPKLRHTRKLKEMIMPACTLYFKGHSPDAIDAVLRQIETSMQGSIYADITISPWFVEELDWSDEIPSKSVFGDTIGNKDRRRQIVEPNRKLAFHDQSLLVRVRKLTFVAPIAKLLLLREMYLEIGRFARD